jgi:hypothetical protein
MILISVKSDFMDVKHQEETDKGAEKYLKRVHALHQVHREYLWKRAERENDTPKARNEKFASRIKSTAKQLFMKTCLPLRIEIINTDANQLNFHHQLK